MAGGRPTKYTDDLGEKLIQWMAQGYSLTAAAGKIGVSRQTVYAWAEEKPEFSNALNIARSQSASWWEDKITGIADGEVDPKASTAVIFALKNRVADEWRDKQEHDHRSGDGSMTPKGIDASQLSDAALQELMNARSSNPD